MRQWSASDGIGGGAIFLPDVAAKAAYGAACRDAWLIGAARHAINLHSLKARRDFINSYPADAQDALKHQIKKLWEDK